MGQTEAIHPPQPRLEPAEHPYLFRRTFGAAPRQKKNKKKPERKGTEKERLQRRIEAKGGLDAPGGWGGEGGKLSQSLR